MDGVIVRLLAMVTTAPAIGVLALTSYTVYCVYLVSCNNPMSQSPSCRKSPSPFSTKRHQIQKKKVSIILYDTKWG